MDGLELEREKYVEEVQQQIAVCQNNINEAQKKIVNLQQLQRKVREMLGELERHACKQEEIFETIGRYNYLLDGISDYCLAQKEYIKGGSYTNLLAYGENIDWEITRKSRDYEAYISGMRMKMNELIQQIN